MGFLLISFFYITIGNRLFAGEAACKNKFSSHSNNNYSRSRELTIPAKNTNNDNSGIVVNIKTYYVARNIDVMKVHSMLYGTQYQQFDKKSVTITIDKDLNQYISIFSYGSCVFFNIPTGELLREISFVELLSSLNA
jgi:uncharacterized Rmd1/YagE family protein